MNKALILVLIAEFLMVAGQICFKKSANRINIEKTAAKPWIIQLLDGVLAYPLLWLGAAAMTAGLLFWISALTNGQLSFVCLLGSAEYIMALFAARLFLNEKITKTKLIGTLLITLGVILTAVS